MRLTGSPLGPLLAVVGTIRMPALPINRYRLSIETGSRRWGSGVITGVAGTLGGAVVDDPPQPASETISPSAATTNRAARFDVRIWPAMLAPASHGSSVRSYRPTPAVAAALAGTVSPRSTASRRRRG